MAIFGYSEAAMFLRRAPRPNIAGIISIHGRRESAVKADGVPRLDLAFDDVEVDGPNDMVSMQRRLRRRRWAEQNGLVETPPVAADVAAIIGFAEQLHETEGTVLCHCGGGMSRAPAAALICLSVWRGPGSATECDAEVIRLRRGAVPHVGLIQLADELLHRNGALVSALAAARAEGSDC